MSETYKKLKRHIRGRFLIGLVVFAPFGLTFYILVRLVNFGKELLSEPILDFLRWGKDQGWFAHLETFYSPETQEFAWYVDYFALSVSILLVLFILYLVGLLSATLFGRRYIGIGERILRHVPGALFVYNTIKQLVEILSRPKSSAFKKVVLVEYPRKDAWCVAFFTGVSHDTQTGETLVNVFLPSTPNPTTGFLILLKPEDVRLTNLAVSQASRFIFSFGVVELENLKSGVFPPEEYENLADSEAYSKVDAKREKEPLRSDEVARPDPAESNRERARRD
ncbi:DUF502 domain-containing protein [bacterium]|nr:DUF502 domain-containing protein [bacterium]